MPPAYADRLPVQIVQYFRDFERTAELVKKQYLFAVVIVYPAELVIRRSVHVVIAVFLENITCLSAPRRAVYVIDFHIAKHPLELVFQVRLPVFLCPFHNADKAVAVLFGKVVKTHSVFYIVHNVGQVGAFSVLDKFAVFVVLRAYARFFVHTVFAGL